MYHAYPHIKVMMQTAIGLTRVSPGWRYEDNSVAKALVKTAASTSQEYKGYMVIKTHVPRIGSKFGPDKFRINSGYMSVYNHITTVFLASRGSCFDKSFGYIGT